MTCDKEGSDGEEVVCKFIWGASRCVFVLIVNHELDAMLFKDGLNEASSDSRKAVFVHDGKASEIAFEREVQNPLESAATKVDTRGDVRDDLKSGVGGGKVILLTSQVVDLFGRGDAGVCDV
jgi:hypothetical protein